MCGIIGCRGKGDVSQIAFECLKKLEYRGYDSWGIAVNINPKIFLYKDIGKISSAAKKEFPSNGTAIAHTRWATHGSVTKENAHPHLSQNKKIAVVHNGIIENYFALKDLLEKEGFSFRSQTDTEVIPNLIELYLRKGKSFRQATAHALKKLDGSYAIVAMHSDSSELVGARNGSPLVVGVDGDTTFFASDVPAFLDRTRKVFYLEDGELACVDSTLEFFELASDRKIEKKPSTINWSVEQAKKGKFPHFMLKEIHEQHSTIRHAIEQDPKLVQKVTGMIKDAKGVFFTGSGTSYHACVSAAYWFSSIAKMHVNVGLASEFSNFKHFLNDKSLVVAVSQSGETADVLDAVKSAKEKGAMIVSIVNVMGSTLTRSSSESIMMNSGPEICVLSTKTYTAQLAILLMLAFHVAGKKDKAKKMLEEASLRIKPLISSVEKKTRALARDTANKKDFFLIGRKLAFPSALEGALKIKEVSYIHAEGFAGGELKHGTIALIEKGVPVIVLSTNETRSIILSNAMEIKSRGGTIIGIDSQENPLYDYFIQVPDAEEANPILMIIPIQILAYYLALEKNLDPDKPRNLAKSVTVK